MTQAPEHMPPSTAWRRTLTRAQLDAMRAKNREQQARTLQKVPPPTKRWDPWTTAEMEFVEQFADEPIAEVAKALGRSYNSIGWMRKKLGVSKPRNQYERLKGIDE